MAAEEEEQETDLDLLSLPNRASQGTEDIRSCGKEPSVRRIIPKVNYLVVTKTTYRPERVDESRRVCVRVLEIGDVGVVISRTSDYDSSIQLVLLTVAPARENKL